MRKSRNLKSKMIVNCQIYSWEAIFKIISENIEKFRVWNFFGDCNLVKVENRYMADFVHFLVF